MKNTLRALLGVSALAFLLVASPVLAAEVDVTFENHKTGADSENNNTVTEHGDGDVTVTNVGNVGNAANVTADTGNNTQSRNTGTDGAGDPDTGSVDVSGEWDSIVNSSDDLCDCIFGNEGWEVEADFLNDTTGADSDNFNTLTVDNDGDVTLTNIASIANSLIVNADTGDNVQDRNTLVGEIMTGDVTVGDIDILNVANSSDGHGSSFGQSNSVDFTSTNRVTGANSGNINTVTVNGGGNTTLTNVASISNGVNVTADTGNNTQTRNTKAGDITTGEVAVSADIVNVANSGSSACCVVGGHTDVTVDATNDTTGADSNNRNTVTVNNDGNTNVHNNANVSNGLTVNADTGDNTQERNTVAGEIETGDVSVELNITNQVN
jgi:hypothetical protein